MLAARSDLVQPGKPKPRKTARSWTPARLRKLRATMRAKAEPRKKHSQGRGANTYGYGVKFVHIQYVYSTFFVILHPYPVPLLDSRD